MMEVIIERCAGLDVHQATVVACVLIGQAGRKPHKEIRTFSTMTRDLKGRTELDNKVTGVSSPTAWDLYRRASERAVSGR
jgi:hypothetical protein